MERFVYALRQSFGRFAFASLWLAHSVPPTQQLDLGIDNLWIGVVAEKDLSESAASRKFKKAWLISFYARIKQKGLFLWPRLRRSDVRPNCGGDLEEERGHSLVS